MSSLHELSDQNFPDDLVADAAKWTSSGADIFGQRHHAYRLLCSLFFLMQAGEAVKLTALHLATLNLDTQNVLLHAGYGCRLSRKLC